MPVTLRATTIGSLAEETLKTTEDTEIIGQVVSAFPNSFYLKTSTDELIFVVNRPLRSPITVNIDSASALDQIVKLLDFVYSDGEQIRVSGVVVDLEQALPYESKRSYSQQTSESFAEIGEPLRAISFILRIIDTSQSVLDLRGLSHGGATRFVNDGVLILRREGMEQRFHQAALGIIGLGSGFTPSGDDTLGGFLAVYNALAGSVSRPPIALDFATLEDRTSWISAKLLDYMQRLVLDEQLSSVIDTAVSGDPDALVLKLETLLPRGHTSGIDIAVGMILALSLIRDIASHEKWTEAIVGALGLR